MTIDRNMMLALEADAEKLRQITGDDRHRILFEDEPCDICGCWPCAHTNPDTWEFVDGAPSLKAEYF